MLPDCRTPEPTFAIPTFAVIPSDVEGFLEELWEFQSTFHDCFARSEPRAHFFASMVGQFRKLERKSSEPMALHVEGGTIRGMQRFLSDVVWDEEQMLWNYHQLVADELGDPEGVWCAKMLSRHHLLTTRIIVLQAATMEQGQSLAVRSRTRDLRGRIRLGKPVRRLLQA